MRKFIRVHSIQGTHTHVYLLRGFKYMYGYLRVFVCMYVPLLASQPRHASSPLSSFPIPLSTLPPAQLACSSLVQLVVRHFTGACLKYFHFIAFYCILNAINISASDFTRGLACAPKPLGSGLIWREFFATNLWHIWHDLVVPATFAGRVSCG